MEIKDINNLGHDLEDDPVFVMSTAAEALDLLGHYSMDFTDRSKDQEDLASLLRIISTYLRTKVDKIDKVK